MKIIQQRLVLFGFLKFLLAALAPDNYSIFPSTPKNTTLTLVHGLQVSLTRTSPGGAANNAGGQHDPRDAYVATRGGLVRVPPNNVWPQQAGAAAGAGHQGLPGEGAAPAAGDDHAAGAAHYLHNHRFGQDPTLGPVHANNIRVAAREYQQGLRERQQLRLQQQAAAATAGAGHPRHRGGGENAPAVDGPRPAAGEQA